MVHPVRVHTEEHIRHVERLAREIYYPTYSPYVHQDHIEYFLVTFQSFEAIKRQIQSDFVYYLWMDKEKAIGYLGIQFEAKLAHLSKLYFLPDHRRLGLGKEAMNLTFQEVREKHLSQIRVVVNENNHGAIRFYQKHGFFIQESVTHSFENGHSVQDLILLLSLSSQE
ncbi:GNAT family N-acetyltransferase [bacterium SCSIO 12741]|nr:GNAT family N-acetyltransferase [bacterium SCSIO 12741]